MAKHAGKKILREPVEVVKNVTGVSDQATGENQAMEALEQGLQGQQQVGAQDDSGQPKGFKNVQDFQKYQKLSPKRDEMELAVVRKNLLKEFGLDTSVEGGMQKARIEREQKEKEREQVEVKKKEEKKMIDLQVKKQEEDMAVRAAKSAASAERKMWGAG